MNGVARVAVFNWPRYAVGAIFVAIGGTAPMPDPWRYSVRAGSALSGFWIVASLAVTWRVYDRTKLYDWRWALALVPEAPGRYAVVSTGLDEVSGALCRLLPDAESILLDLYDPALTRAGSIRRARALTPAPIGARHARPDALPVEDGHLDAVFVVFAAHELRAAPHRRALYAEIARILRPGGRLVLVEHCRDAANILAYGPGAWHFFPRTEWLRLGRRAGLVPAGEATMTPLVRALAFRR